MYDYEKEKPYLFTDDGQRMFLKVRDTASNLCALAGACSVSQATRGLSGSSWRMLACVDRLVELGEFRYVNTDYVKQDHVLIKFRGNS